MIFACCDDVVRKEVKAAYTSSLRPPILVAESMPIPTDFCLLTTVSCASVLAGVHMRHVIFFRTHNLLALTLAPRNISLCELKMLSFSRKRNREGHDKIAAEWTKKYAT